MAESHIDAKERSRKVEQISETIASIRPKEDERRTENENMENEQSEESRPKENEKDQETENNLERIDGNTKNDEKTRSAEEGNGEDDETNSEIEAVDTVDNETDFFIPLDNLTEYLGEEIFLRFIRADVLVRREPHVVGTSGNANIIVDQLISKIQQLIRNHDLDQVKTLDVNKSIRWIVVSGLGSIKRAGDATMKIEEHSIVVEANIGFADIAIFCSLNHQVKWFIRLNGNANARTSDLSGFAKFRILPLEELQLNLEDFQITNWGDLKVKLTGENCLGSIAGFFVNNFQRTVTNIIKQKVPPLILSSIQKKLTQLAFLNTDSSKKAVATLLESCKETTNDLEEKDEIDFRQQNTEEDNNKLLS